MRKLDIRLLRLLRNSKGQFISIAMVVTLGLCMYVSFSMTAMNLKNTVDYYYELTNFGDIFAQVVKIPESALDKVREIDGIEVVQGRVSFDVPLKVENDKEKVRVRIISLPDQEKRINDLYMLEGKILEGQPKKVVVLEQFAKARNITVGDKIAAYINGRVVQLDVSGIVASSEYVYLMENEQALLPAPEKFGVVFVSEEFAQMTFGYQDSYNELLIQIKDQEKMDEVVKKLEERLDRYGVKRIIEGKDQLSNRMLTEEVKQLDNMSKTIPLLFLSVAAIIIYIMLTRIVKNDRIYIGVLKAIGYGNYEILSHYVKFSLVIGITGAMIGNGVGIMLSGLLAQVYVMYYNLPLLRSQIYYGYMVNAVLLTCIFCIFAGLMGARPVLGIMPADSMRPEAPKTGGRILLERIPWFWKHVSFSWKMVIRNIARSKKRFVFLVLGIALTYGITVVPIFQGGAMVNMFTLHYGEFQKMDYSIDFNKPMNRKAMIEVKQLADIRYIEPKLEYPFELRTGWRKKVVSIVGVPRDTQFYDFTNKNQGSIRLPEKGIFLTAGLAKVLNVQEGDLITIKNFIPGKEDVKVEVKGIVEQYIGVNAYMNIVEMENTLTEKGMITGVNIRSKDRVQDKVKDIKHVAVVQSVDDMKNSFLQFLDAAKYSTGVMMIFGGILGFAIVYNSTIISIAERSMEFSSLRVLGFEKKNIYQMITKENMLMTVVAIILGIPIGYGMCNGIAQAFNTDIFSIPVFLTPDVFITAAIATIGFVFIAQLATLKKIYGLNFIEALKNRVS
ncbi:ABC transporter permease [Anaerosolibacter sp.]|uniref:ABC transporter permease n=1 Tax=Anaerosolibacter sp. TaxID=1872527 RepID=UPI0039EF674B